MPNLALNMFRGVVGLVGIYALWIAISNAYEIRLYAIKDYGLVIHEFDPWFNYRATEYLDEHGLTEFFHWYDYKSWYPLGRPVGTTIYPGMQMSSVAIKNILNWLGHEISLNDVCCMVPVWFGCSATFFLGLLAYETSKSVAVAAVASLIMAIIPAHIMRSVGGGYDNESVAMTAMCATFYFWCRSIRENPNQKDGEPTKDSIVFGIITGIAYIYMVAAWGGFVFVLNMIGVHAAVLVCLGRYSSKIHRAYSLFYVIGTIGAIQVPVVGWNPLKSLEQIGPLVVFLVYQVLEFCEIQRRKRNLNVVEVFKLRVMTFLPAFAAIGLVAYYLFSIGHFGPLTARVRGLFVKHTRTGNPLVDSVAEHQPANEAAYSQYLSDALYALCPYGFGITILKCLRQFTDSRSFVLMYASAAYFFASKMSRLIILLGPVASICGGMLIGSIIDFALIDPISHLITNLTGKSAVGNEETEDNDDTPDKKDKAPKKKPGIIVRTVDYMVALVSKLHGLVVKALGIFDISVICMARIVFGAWILYGAKYGYTFNTGLWDPQTKATEFFDYSHSMAVRSSHPSIMFKAQLRNGETIIVDDYREAYWWLRDNTPEDARVLAWWDYGYQITGIGNRTTLADGNTWNHEHIATLGRILTSSVKKSHRIAKHVADYVLVWSGGGGDDLAKSPHMARIGNSVYPDMCPGDPTCSKFGFYSNRMPTPMMEKSLLYHLTQVGYKEGVTLDSSRYTHAFTSKYGKCRVFKIQNVDQKSKAWVANPANRVCDAPGSWYCTGQYPPALDKLIASRRNFAQLENFNVKKSEESEKYTQDYLDRMEGRKSGASGEAKKGTNKKSKKKSSLSKGLKFVGCYGSETHFSQDKVYQGGPAGSNIKLATANALKLEKKYLAMARSGIQGHSFAFDKITKGQEFSPEECGVPCLDSEDMACGCADASCGDLSKADGEEHLRRWIVYEVKSAFQRKWKKKQAEKEEL